MWWGCGILAGQVKILPSTYLTSPTEKKSGLCSLSSAGVTLSHLFVLNIQIPNCCVQRVWPEILPMAPPNIQYFVTEDGGDTLSQTGWKRPSRILPFEYCYFHWCCHWHAEHCGRSHYIISCVILAPKTLNEGAVMLCEGSNCDIWDVYKECQALWYWGVTSESMCSLGRMIGLG